MDIVKKHIRNTLISLPISLLMLPLFFQPGSGITDYRNLSILYIYFSFVLVCSSLLFLIIKKKLEISLLDVILSLFIGYKVCISSIKFDHVFQNDEITTLLIFYFVFFIFRSFFKKDWKIFCLFLSIIIFGVIVEILGLLQLFRILRPTDSFNTVTSIFKDPNIFASFLSALLPFAFSLFNSPLRLKWQKNVICSLLILFVGLCYFFALITVSRIAIIVAIVVSLLTARPKIFTKKIFGGLVFSLILLTGLFLILRVKTGSSQGRILIWKVSFNMLSNSPITGIGPGRFQSEYNNYQSNYFSAGKHTKQEINLASETFVPFNEFLRIVIEDGIIGLFLFMLIFIYLLKIGIGNGKKFRDQPALIFIFCVLTISLVSFPLQDFVFSLYFYAMLGIISSTYERKKIEVNNILTLKILVVLIIVSNVFLFTDRYLALKKWFNLRAERILDQQTLADYQYLYPKLNQNGLFLIDYGERLFINGEIKNSLKVMNRAKTYLPCVQLYIRLGAIYKNTNNFIMAEKNYIYAGNMVPNRFRPKYALFDLYKQTSQWNKCFQLGNEILKMPIKVPSYEVTLIKNQVQIYLDSLR